MAKRFSTEFNEKYSRWRAKMKVKRKAFKRITKIIRQRRLDHQSKHWWKKNNQIVNFMSCRRLVVRGNVKWTVGR